MVKRIGWYLNRFQTMSGMEMGFRAQQLLQRLWEQRFSMGKFPSERSITTNPRLMSKLDLSGYELAQETIAIFGKPFNYMASDINWHQDIFTGGSFPLSFSKTINIRRTHEVSAKNVWEINRLQFLPLLAINYQKTGQEVYLQQIVRIIDGWIEQNPYLTGINWYSNIEVNLRLISWYFCWIILQVDDLMAKDPSLKTFVEKRWLPSIYQHCQYSHRNPSRFSSANNHLISEYAGLFVAASLWNFQESTTWLKYARGPGEGNSIATFLGRQQRGSC